MPQNYNDTIHKMATPFEMRAGLPKKEPKMLEDWEKNYVYEKMIEHNADLPRFVLHDGPPYANGNIHMGTALNKIIKISSSVKRTCRATVLPMFPAMIPPVCPLS